MRQISQFHCVDVPNDNQPAKGLVILFHGYGADAYDLQTLSDVLSPDSPLDFLFPQGPLEVPIGPGWTGRAWWNINVEELQKAAAEGRPRDMTQENPEGLKNLRPKIQKFLAQTGYPLSQIILGGFSQGAMLATDTYLHLEENCAGLMILSGTLICSETWKTLAQKKAGQRFFQSHGSADGVLAHKGAQQLETLLTQAGMKGRLDTFKGGHEIPMPTVQGAAKYIKSCFTSK